MGLIVGHVEDAYEKEADRMAKQVMALSNDVQKAEKVAEADAKKKLAPLKKAAAEASKQSAAAHKAIAAAKKANGGDEKANKEVQVQAAKAVKTAAAVKKLIVPETCAIVEKAVPKAKAKQMEKTFAEKLKFWQDLEKKAKK